MVLLTPLIKQVFGSEIEIHLDVDSEDDNRRRNSRSRKMLKASAGSLELETPRDGKSFISYYLIQKMWI